LWDAIVERLEDETELDFRHQASIWVIRKESNGKLRWRLLPLHAAIVLGAPAAVTEAILEANVYAASQKDDQGMLPLHLAFRNFQTTSPSVIQELLTAYPAAVSQRDRKNRTPLAAGLLANPNGHMLPVLHLYATIVAANARVEIKRDECDQHRTELHKLQVLHEQRLRQLRDEYNNKNHNHQQQQQHRQQQSPAATAAPSPLAASPQPLLPATTTTQSSVPNNELLVALAQSLQQRKELYERDVQLLAALQLQQQQQQSNTTNNNNNASASSLHNVNNSNAANMEQQHHRSLADILDETSSVGAEEE
jgi:hypothetical protein